MKARRFGLYRFNLDGTKQLIRQGSIDALNDFAIKKDWKWIKEPSLFGGHWQHGNKAYVFDIVSTHDGKPQPDKTEEAITEHDDYELPLDTSRFLTWKVEETATGVLVALKDRAFELPYSFQEVKEAIEAIRATYADLPAEFDTMVEAYLTELCEHEGEPTQEPGLLAESVEEATKLPKFQDWQVSAGGTGGWEGANGYSTRGDFGEYHISPVSRNGRKGYYLVQFANTKGKHDPDGVYRSGLWRDVGKATAPTKAYKLAVDHAASMTDGKKGSEAAEAHSAGIAEAFDAQEHANTLKGGSYGFIQLRDAVVEENNALRLWKKEMDEAYRINSAPVPPMRPLKSTWPLERSVSRQEAVEAFKDVFSIDSSGIADGGDTVSASRSPEIRG